MARRYSGNLSVTVLYEDEGRDGRYRVTVSNGRDAYKTFLRPPASGFGPGIAYDSPEAYDRVARAAISFAIDEHPEAFPDVSPDDVARTKKPIRRNPKRRSRR